MRLIQLLKIIPITEVCPTTAAVPTTELLTRFVPTTGVCLCAIKFTHPLRFVPTTDDRPDDTDDSPDYT